MEAIGLDLDTALSDSGIESKLPRVEYGGLSLCVLRSIEEAKGHAWLAGGALRSLVDGTKISDYDIFFESQEYYIPVLAELIARGFVIVSRCPVGSLITLKRNGVKVQLVMVSFHPRMEDTIAEFDVTACCAAYNPYHNTYAQDIRFHKDAKSRVIRYRKITYPLATFNRTVKYVNKGYKMQPEGLLEFMGASRIALSTAGDASDKTVWGTYVD